MSESDREQLLSGREDLAYHQMRVLMLVEAVASSDGHAGKLDGLTKLAKLDFLVRYPDLARQVLDDIDESDSRSAIGSSYLDVEAPMTRYKYGPWDDRYYAIIGALVGRGLLRYVKGRRGSVALKPTPAGKRLATALASSEEWADTARQCQTVARASSGLTGSALKDRIYARLPDVLDRPYREVIQ
ncbi:hypothetical protein GCM10009836_43630 [Pseudonocardia ailaonensis]|uniref:MarR family transcriptional regulator n=1 Tax=Pseudonocardia ailaonensis TaxID=367279 RepID=A0ABN2NA07_9PSEU